MSSPPVKPTCEAIIDLFPNRFVIVDRDFRIVCANLQYKDHYQIADEDIVGKHCFQISQPIEHACSQNGKHYPSERVIESGQPASVMHISQ